MIPRKFKLFIQRKVIILLRKLFKKVVAIIISILMKSSPGVKIVKVYVRVTLYTVLSKSAQRCKRV